MMILPIGVAAAALSGPQALAQAQAWQDQFVTELTFGIILLACSLLVAFFKFETVKPRIPQLSIPQPTVHQLSKPSELSTEDLIAELKQRMPRA